MLYNGRISAGTARVYALILARFKYGPKLQIPRPVLRSVSAEHAVHIKNII